MCTTLVTLIIFFSQYGDYCVVTCSLARWRLFEKREKRKLCQNFNIYNVSCVRRFFAIDGRKKWQACLVDDRHLANRPWSVRGRKILFVSRCNGDPKTWLPCIAHSPLTHLCETAALIHIVQVYLSHSLISSERDLYWHWKTWNLHAVILIIHLYSLICIHNLYSLIDPQT